MSVLLQISDTHFGTEQAPVVDALLALAQQQQPDLVVLSGDVTQRARPAQFRAARAFLDRIARPTLVVPGNHDIPLYAVLTRAFAPYARYRAVLGDELEPVHSSDDLLVVCINTTRRYRHVNGEISAAQIERAAARFRSAAPTQLRIAVVHQPVAVLRSGDAHDLLRGHAAAVRSWAEAGADLVLGGHIHLPYVSELTQQQQEQQQNRALWAVQAGTALSSRVRGGVPNSVNLLRWDAGAAERCCAIERWDFAPDRQSFAHVMTTKAKLGCAAAAPAAARPDAPRSS